MIEVGPIVTGVLAQTQGLSTSNLLSNLVNAGVGGVILAAIKLFLDRDKKRDEMFLVVITEIRRQLERIEDRHIEKLDEIEAKRSADFAEVVAKTRESLNLIHSEMARSISDLAASIARHDLVLASLKSEIAARVGVGRKRRREGGGSEPQGSGGEAESVV